MPNDFAYKRILDSALKIAEQNYAADQGLNFKSTLSQNARTWIGILIENLEKNKSVPDALITCLMKKLEDPKQDVRQHKEELTGGYSARTLDTSTTVPWMKEHFTRFSPSESAWLTRSIEQAHALDLSFPGKIRPDTVKKAFLGILNDIENNHADSRKYLIAIFIGYLDLKVKNMTIVSQNAGTVSSAVTIDLVIQMLKEHFQTATASRLPVIAVYSIYELLIGNTKIYTNKILEPPKSHTVADRYTGYGDIEIKDQNGRPFEGVEVKHEKPITEGMIKDIKTKIAGTTIKRYFILTTAEPNFAEKEEKEIFALVHDIKATVGVDVTPNGVLQSIKYYLRFVDPVAFIDCYTKNLEGEFKTRTEIKKGHITSWFDIRKRYKI